MMRLIGQRAARVAVLRPLLLPAMLLPATLLIAACSSAGDDPAGRSGGWSIDAGVYSNVATAEDGTTHGFELALPEGDQSRTAMLRMCETNCGEPREVTLMRGLNGVSFSVSEKGRTADVMVTPLRKGAVTMNADWGAGLEAVELPLRDADGGVGDPLAASDE